MWGAITKDFGEFVSTVAADATETLDSIDQTLDEPLVKGRRRRTSDEDGDNTDDDNNNSRHNDNEPRTSEALIDPDTGIPLDNDSDTGPPATPKIPWKAPTEATPEEMKERLVSCEDVFLDPLVVSGDNHNNNVDDEANDDEAATPATAAEATPPPATAEEDDNTEPETNESSSSEEPPASAPPNQEIDDAVATFLNDFDVATKTEEISELLKTNAALKTTFSILSDSVTYADFWTRYFYRIDDEQQNLVATYSFYYQNHLQNLQLERERELEAETANAAEAANVSRATMGGLSSFFGGVVTRLTKDEAEEDGTDFNDDPDTSGVVDESLDQTMDSEDGTVDGPVSAARTAFGFLSTVAGGGGRPPFVMNTAISDDDDDDDDVEDEDDDDSDVELGWDDDDDEEDFDGLDDEDNTNPNAGAIAFADDDDRSETVDFKDAEKEGLLEELEQARSERDALQKTVEMQAEELQKAANAVQSNSNSASPIAVPVASSDDSGKSDGDVTQSLRLTLFEKDAELAALRAKLEDRHDDNNNDNDQQAELEQLKKALEDKDRDIEALKKTTRAEAETKALEQDQKLEEQQSKQQTELQSIRDTVSARDEELQTLQHAKKDEASKHQQKLDEKQAEKEEMILALQSQIYALERQVEEKEPPKESGDEADGNEEAEELKEALASRDAAIAALQSGSKAELLELSAQHATTTQALEEQLSTHETTLHTLRATTDDDAKGLRKKLSSLSEELKTSKEDSSKAQQEIETLRSELDQLRTSSPGSSSSGVKVDGDVPEDAMNNATANPTNPTTTIAASVPPSKIPNKPNAAASLGLEPSENDGNDDGGWGDDW